MTETTTGFQVKARDHDGNVHDERWSGDFATAGNALMTAREDPAVAEAWMEDSAGTVLLGPADSPANYDILLPSQRAEFDRLMTIPTNTWPEALMRHVRAAGGPFSGDALADAVAGWVREAREPVITETSVPRADWTTDPETGRSNSSPLFRSLVDEVERLIRGEAHALISGRADIAAQLIMAQLAHVHHLAPAAEREPAETGEPR